MLNNFKQLLSLFLSIHIPYYTAGGLVFDHKLSEIAISYYYSVDIIMCYENSTRDVTVKAIAQFNKEIFVFFFPKYIH